MAHKVHEKISSEPAKNKEMNKLFLEYIVTPCERKEIKDFIETWHYSKNINGVLSDYCFKMQREKEIIGAAIFGKPAMAKQLDRFGKETLELRRLVCVDNTHRNAESFFIGRMLRWLKNKTNVRNVVSYSDPEYGHEGIVYKASNFILKGKTAEGRVIIYKGKKYHDKTIRTKYKGNLKPFALKIKQALESGEAYYKDTRGKNIYVYFLR